MPRHKVTKKECEEALQYFHSMGMIENQCGDAEYYINILLRRVANDYNIHLTLENGELL